VIVEVAGYRVLMKKKPSRHCPGAKRKQKVEVKKIADPEDEASQLVLCRSAQRRLKEEAMVSTAEARS